MVEHSSRMEHSSRVEGSGTPHARADESIDEAGKESFPASDPPATWSGTDRRDVNR
jgi:hypothetical protein